MPTFEEELNVKTKLDELLKEICQLKPDVLIRKNLGPLSFEKGSPYFERILWLFQELKECNLDNVPFNKINELLSKVNEFKKSVQEINEFSLDKFSQNPSTVRDDLINRISSQYDGFFNAISPIISFSIRKGTDFEALEKHAKSVVDNIEEKYKQFEDSIKEKLNEAESILQKIQQAAAEVGVAQHSTHFEIMAEEHRSQSFWWLIATIIMVALTVGWGFLTFYFHPQDQYTTAQTIHWAMSKLIILSALYYGLVWTARNYNAHRHNYVINKHRKNCLSTFEAFVKAAGNDVETKNAVLLQTTQSIFSAQVSGYVKQESETESPNKFIEIFKTIGTPHKG